MKTVLVTLLAIAASSEAILPLLLGKKHKLLPQVYHQRVYHEPIYPIVEHYPVQTIRRVDTLPTVYEYTSNVHHIPQQITNLQPVGQPISVYETVQPSNAYPTYTHVNTQVAKSSATVYKVSVPVTYTNIVQGPTHHTLTQYSNTYAEPAAYRGRYINGVWCD